VSTLLLVHNPREDALDRITTHFDRSRRAEQPVFESGPFTLYWDFARPTIGATRFTVEDVKTLVRQANEDPPWGSIHPNPWLVEWNKLVWLSDQVPDLTTVVRDARMGVYENPLLIKRARFDRPPPPADPDASWEIVGPDTDLRELEAAYQFADWPGMPPPSVTTEEGLALQRSRIASMPAVDPQRRLDPSVGQVVVRYRGTIVAAGMHEPFGDASEITSLGVLPGFRRRGYGTTLANALAWDAFNRRVDLVFVESASDAVPMYERAGFQGVGAIAGSPL
jgi:ribosomal protein S18 acetylase RimI-like enzyme